MIKIHLLSNDIRLVCEHISYVNSVSVGVWVKSGSAYEQIRFHGMSHFIEHMLFKGTKTKSAERIATIMDDVGGQLNAFTSRDCTCFYTKTLSADLDVALDLLSDMIINPKLSSADIDMEKGVVHEEINMYEDTPDELVMDNLYALCYDGFAIGRPILGTHDSIDSFNASLIKEYMDKMYCSDNVVISVAGNFDEDVLVEKAEAYFGNIRRGDADVKESEPIFTPGSIRVEKLIEQAHIAVCYPSYRFTDENMYAMTLVSTILGGGMSSRLFQNLREKQGLCYSVYSFQTCGKESGNVTLYAGCAKENADLVLELMQKEAENIKNFSKEEFLRAKRQFIGNFILGNESISGRMSSYGKQLLLYDKISEEADVTSKIESITYDEAKEATKFFNNDFCAVSAVIPQ